MRSLLACLCLFWAGTERSGASSLNLPLMEYLDQNHLVCLKWGFEDQQGNITFKLTVNTTGWVGFGLSPNGDMVGADIVIGGLGPSGSYFKDYHGVGKFKPVEDTQQNYHLHSLTESDGQTIMTFCRSIPSCDNQDFHITAQPIKLIYAYGLTDDIAYHEGRRGTMEINLLNHRPMTTVTDLDYLNATMDKVNIPPVETYYHCRITKLQALNTTHHIFLIKPEIENLDVVHHMLLYRCPSYVTEPNDTNCANLGHEWDTCFEVVAGWAVGGGEYKFPEDAGIPVGGEDRDVFYRLEIHYNNVKKEAGITDSSGLRLYYRPVNGQHDVGVLTTGLIPGFSMEYDIPPKVKRFHTYGMCNTTLASQLVDTLPDLQVFGVLLHTHYAGREIRVAQFRDGQQIDFVAMDLNYNFAMQQIVNLGAIKSIKHGDEILVECTYSTVNRTKVTKQGLGSSDEMCLAFLFYYPAVKITSCLSHPNTLHPLMTTSAQMFEGNQAVDQDEIVKYETLLKSIPQIQMVSDDHFNVSYYVNGKIREMKMTPTVTCDTTNTSSRLVPSWILNAAGIILLLLRIAVV